MKWLALVALALFACGSGSPPADSGPRDAQTLDASPRDAGVDAPSAPDASEEEDAAIEPPRDGGVDAEIDPGPPVHERPQSHTQSLLFDPARDRGDTIGYHSFRIPAIARVGHTLLAFAEGRACSADDYGNINLVMKRSRDDGRTWGPLEEVEGRGPGTWGNPTPVVDASTGRVFLFLSFNAEDVSQFGRENPCTGETTRVIADGERRVYLTTSDDEGDSWTTPTDLTDTLQIPGTAWDAMGPGIGIQTTIADEGRLIVPASQRNLYSDDHGATWRYQRIPSGTSEGTIAELSDGTLLRNDRAVPRLWEMAARRWLSRGTIDPASGTTTQFETFAPHDTLLDPRAQGSSLVYTTSPHRLLFLNASSSELRCRMRVRISYDDGRTWPIDRRLHDDVPSDETCTRRLGGYSSMIKTGDYHVAALVERGADAGGHRSIELHRFNLPWVLNGTPEP
ncbi:MAG: exo-alpha-sialidase [Sandaracinus sp.]|nr:exo-alpha-sialidase [Myxococcales bacterium]MCB9616894.1 exo-alpha-sialidase [Sandaracinus sp.]